MTNESVRNRITAQIQGCKSNGVDFTDLVREKFNCLEASADDDGDVWIEGPQVGHWLNEDKLTELADWIDTNA